MWTCPKCDRAGNPHRRCKCGYLADEQPTSEAVTDTCPTCGSDKRDINGRAWLRMREGNCPDPWHDQPDTDAVEAALHTLAEAAVFHAEDAWHDAQPAIDLLRSTITALRAERDEALAMCELLAERFGDKVGLNREYVLNVTKADIRRTRGGA